MTNLTKQICGIIVLTMPTIEYGGTFLLGILSGNHSDMCLTTFQQSMFRAGHAHAGVIVILSLITQILADHTALPISLNWTARMGVPLSAIIISGGFFAAAAGEGATQPNGFISLVYLGAGMLAVALIILGIGLIRGGIPKS